jgi:NADH dehydrogenase (ubiquinone) Fe-S protein 8
VRLVANPSDIRPLKFRLTFDTANADERATMSFARQWLALGVSSRLRALPRSNFSQSSLITYRLLTTTSPRLHAEPINVKHEEPHHGYRVDPAGLKSPTGTGTLTAGKDVNPYKGKQGAIDKAVHMFFLTEIMRGANLVLPNISNGTDCHL